MASKGTLRAEVGLSASRTWFTSNEPNFNLIVHIKLHNCEGPLIFLLQPLEDHEGLHSLISQQFIQCFDDTGEVHQLRYGEMPWLLQSYKEGLIRFKMYLTTADPPNFHSWSFGIEGLDPGRSYMLRFNPPEKLTHWSASEAEYLSSYAEMPNDSLFIKELPEPSKMEIAWKACGNPPVFHVRDSILKAPKVTVSLDAPATYSLSRNPPFQYTLTFTTDHPKGITVYADRPGILSLDSDIAVIDPVFGAHIGPDRIDVCDEGGVRQDQHTRIEGTYIEHRELDVGKGEGGWYDFGGLQIGKEYILRSLGGSWFAWSEDTVDEVMSYSNRDGFGIESRAAETIEFDGAGDKVFLVVE